MKHFTDFERIALINDKDWVRNTVRGFGFAFPGEVRVCEDNELEEARAWLEQQDSTG